MNATTVKLYRPSAKQIYKKLVAFNCCGVGRSSREAVEQLVKAALFTLLTVYGALAVLTRASGGCYSDGSKFER